MEETFGQRVKRLRVARGATQNDVDRAIRASAGQTSRWERGDVEMPRREYLEALAAFFSVTIHYLRTGEPERRVPELQPMREAVIRVETALGRDALVELVASVVAKAEELLARRGGGGKLTPWTPR